MVLVMISIHHAVAAPLRDELCAFLRGVGPERGVCFEHDPRWLAVLEAGLGHEAVVMVARGQDGAIRGYLPLAMVRSRLFGRFLVSLPYLNRAGVVADDQAVAAALFERAVELAEQRDADYLELRHGAHAIQHPQVTHDKAEKVRMVLRLAENEAALWTSLDAKVRNQVRKGDKSELTIRWGGAELLEDFYRVFARNMRDLGTPVYPRKLFAAILQQFPQEAELVVVRHAGAPAAAALLLHDPVERLTQVPSASCLREFNVMNANMWMYHRLLCRAIERGSELFDFGRSSEGSGTWRFKKQWGAEARPTVWQVHLRRGEVNAVRPEHPRFRRRIEAWQKLPVWVTRLVGPVVVRGIP